MYVAIFAVCASVVALTVIQRPSEGPQRNCIGQEQDALGKYIHSHHDATVASKRKGRHTIDECSPTPARAQPPRRFLSCTSTCSGTFKAAQVCP